VKRCHMCGTWKPMDEFYRAKHHRDGRTSYCKPCCYQRRRSYSESSTARENRLEGNRQRGRLRSKEKKRDTKLKGRYGIGVADYEEWLDSQGGVCAICEMLPADGKHLDVDHDHRTGQVRGLLCRRCNYGLGFFGDDGMLLVRAGDYLFDAEQDREESA
jgi:hypothetical protein